MCYLVRKWKNLQKFPKAMWKLKTTHSVPSVRSLLSTVDDMFEKYPDIKNSIVFQALWATVCEKNAKKNAAVDPKLISLYRYLHALNPRACKAVSRNLGGFPSVNWIKVLNTRKRVSCIL